MTPTSHGSLPNQSAETRSVATGLALVSGSQDHGIYPAGSWLRNPPGSVHRPWSDAGCTIWVKTGHLPATVGPFG